MSKLFASNCNNMCTNLVVNYHQDYIVSISYVYHHQRDVCFCNTVGTPGGICDTLFVLNHQVAATNRDNHQKRETPGSDEGTKHNNNNMSSSLKTLELI